MELVKLKLIPWKHFYRRASFISYLDKAHACVYRLAQAFSLSHAFKLSTLLMFPMHVFALSSDNL